MMVSVSNTTKSTSMLIPLVFFTAATESVDPGEQLIISTRVDNDVDLVARTSLRLEDPLIVLEVQSRTFTVQGAAISGTVEPGVESVVVLVGRTQSGQRQDLTTVVGGGGHFEFDDLPPSDESGYWLTYDGSPVVVAPVILVDGDQVNVTNEPLPLSAALESSEAADPAPDSLVVPSPAVLAFESYPKRSTSPLVVPLVVLSGLIVALAIPIRRAAPVRR